MPRLRRTAEPKPPDEYDMDYWKTRVTRVIQRRFRVGSGGSTTARHDLSSQATMLGQGFDPQTGTLWIRITAPPIETSASIEVFWTLHDGTAPYRYRSQPLTINQVNEVRLWGGPVPGAVYYVLTLSNLSPGSKDFRVVADVVAKRKGSNFSLGMCLDVVDPPLSGVQPGTWEPEEPQTSAPTRRSFPCAGRVARSAKRPLEASEPSRGTRNRGGSTTTSAAPKGIENSLQYNPDPATVPSEAPCPQPEGPVCMPEASAEDWWDARRGLPTVCPVADPEVEAYVASPAFSGVISADETSFKFAGLGLSIDFPGGFPGSSAAGHLLVETLGRCEGFDELWDEITDGLDAQRLPRWTLRDLLEWLPGIQGTTPWKGRLTEMFRTASGNRVSSDSELSIESYEAWEPEFWYTVDWQWGRTAVWLDDDHRELWFMASLMNLVHATIHLLPSRIRTPRDKRNLWGKLKDTGAWLKRLWRERKLEWRRGSCTQDAKDYWDGCKMRVIRAHQAAWRMSGAGAPYLKVLPGRADDTRPWVTEFDLETLEWPAGWQGTFESDFQGWPIGAQANARTWGWPPPVPATLRMNAHVWMPYADAAGKLYAASRLAAMACLRLRADGIDESPMREAASRFYRAYLGCLGIPGKTFVHELFHTSRGFARSDPYGGLLVWIARSRRQTHCRTGCGQEKMGTYWYGAMGRQHAMLAIEKRGAPDHPRAFDLSGAALSDYFNSGCKAGQKAVHTSFGAWPASTGQTLSVTWTGDPSSDFLETCMASGDQVVAIR